MASSIQKVGYTNALLRSDERKPVANGSSSSDGDEEGDDDVETDDLTFSKPLPITPSRTPRQQQRYVKNLEVIGKASSRIVREFIPPNGYDVDDDDDGDELLSAIGSSKSGWERSSGSVGLTSYALYADHCDENEGFSNQNSVHKDSVIIDTETTSLLWKANGKESINANMMDDTIALHHCNAENVASSLGALAKVEIPVRRDIATMI